MYDRHAATRFPTDPLMAKVMELLERIAALAHVLQPLFDYVIQRIEAGISSPAKPPPGCDSVAGPVLARPAHCCYPVATSRCESTI